MVSWFFAGMIVSAACWTDMRTSKIPNVLTVFGLLGGIIYHSIAPGGNGLAFAGLGAGAGFIALLGLYLFKALGAGDVKLFAALGAWIGTEWILYCSIYSMIYSAFIAFILLLVRKSRLSKLMDLFLRLQQLLFYRDRTALTFSTVELTTYPFMYAAAPAFVTVVVSIFF
ncbi:A24 family peptidase [Paenibacillus senegalensis]|uniref:A24 family peptidase n=1 Tax=Paenibacillus senegalensis TaxID=1465766 RepID=UPI000288F5D9|nr:prepilin peptidase [Paenibacillus senegalensis]